MTNKFFCILIFIISINCFAEEDWKTNKFKWEPLLKNKENIKIITAGDINGDSKDDIIVLYDKKNDENLIVLISNAGGYTKVDFDFLSSDIIQKNELSDIKLIKVENNKIKCLMDLETSKLIKNTYGIREAELMIEYSENKLKLNKILTTGVYSDYIAQIEYDVLTGNVYYNYLQKKEKVGENNSYYFMNYSRVISNKLKSAIPVDCNLNKWIFISKEQILENNVSKKNISYGFENWRNSFDIKAKYYLAHDDKNIHIIINVTDDIFKQSYDGDKMLRGDHIELWLGTKLDEKYQIGLNPGNFLDINPEALLWYKKNKATSKHPLSSVDVKSKKTELGYILEAKIPLNIFEVKNINEIDKLTLVLSDTDFTDKQEKILSSSTLTWGSLYSLGEVVWKE